VDERVPELRVRGARPAADHRSDGRAARHLHPRRDHPDRFWNEYHWGDLNAGPADLLARYFDVHVYFANWGTRRLMLRLPRAAVDTAALRTYLPGRPAALTTTGEHAVVDLCSETDEPEDDWYQAEHLCGSLTPRSSAGHGAAPDRRRAAGPRRPAPRRQATRDAEEVMITTLLVSAEQVDSLGALLGSGTAASPSSRRRGSPAIGPPSRHKAVDRGVGAYG
jgi:hypothetical protein